jgi:ankyrin repeat protein
MKRNFVFSKKALLLAACCVILAAGCCLFGHHSHYRTIHQLTIDDDSKGVAADLARHPADLELRNDAGQTPLLLAANQCSTNVLALLLKKGAKTDATASGRSTALHLAAQAGCSTAVTLLLDYHCEINPHDDQGRTPLTRAEQFKQQAIVTLLRDRGGTE